MFEWSAENWLTIRVYEFTNCVQHEINNRAIYATAINRNEIENSAVLFKLQRSLEIIKIN